MVVGERIIDDQCPFSIGNFDTGQTEIEFNNERGAHIAMGSTRQSTLDRVEDLFVYLASYVQDTRTWRYPYAYCSKLSLFGWHEGRIGGGHSCLSLSPPAGRPVQRKWTSTITVRTCISYNWIISGREASLSTDFLVPVFFTVHITRAPSRCCPGMPPGGHVRCVINGGWLRSCGYLAAAFPPHPTHKRALNGEH